MVWEQTANTWDEFLKYIEEAKKHLSQGSPEEPKEFWYRGLGKVTYPLTPSLFRYRQSDEEKEKKIFHLYKQIIIQEPNRKSNDWEILFDMQHYGVPTRLLDWTEVLGIAVYFAVTPKWENPCIYILDPVKLNTKSGPNSILNVPDGDRFDYQAIYWRKDPFLGAFPLAISPTFRNDRLQQQRGKFTVHGLNREPLENQCPDCLCKVIFAPEALDETSKFLEIANLNAFSIFPDFVGKANFIKNEVGLKPSPYDEGIADTIRTRLRKIIDKDHQILKESSIGDPRRADLFIKGISACNIGDSFIERQPQNNDLLEWLKNKEKPYIFISGEAGIGKTNFLLRMIIFKKFSKIPVIFFSLKLYESKVPGKKRLEDFLFEYIFPDKVNDTEKFVVREMIKDGEILLILDGLDELARIKSQESVQKVSRELDDFIEGSKRAKVIISCRDHILENLRNSQVLGPEDRSDILKIGKLKQTEIQKKIEELLEKEIKELENSSNIIKNLVDLAEVPLFYHLIQQIINDQERCQSLSEVGNNRAKLYRLWFEIILEKHGWSDSMTEMEMRKIGQVAKEMLEKRIDFVELNNLDQDCRQLVEQLCDRPFGVFVEELKDTKATFTFSHQSLREFILAWSVYEEIKDKNFKVLSETPSFDYEGAETYRYLADLINLQKDLVNEMENILNAKSLDKLGWNNWNNVIRNLFEAVGILASDDNNLLNTVVDQLLDLLEKKYYENEGKKIYISYKTKYNIVRCLERIHPSAPKPYYKLVLNNTSLWDEEIDGDNISDNVSLRNKEIGRDNIPAYAIRGFHLSEPRLGKFPRMIFKGSDGSDMEDKVSNCLLSIIESLKAEELSQDAEFLRINCTFALIRWLPVDRYLDRLKGLLNQENRDKFMEANIFWMLYRRYGEDIPEEFKRLFTKVKVEDLGKKAPNEAKNALKILKKESG